MLTVPASVNPVTVSVVVPTIGRQELARALRAVRAQQTSATIELIVVVDQAADTTELPHDVIDMADRILHTGGGRGASYARNLGVAEARGEYIAFLDDDDEWLPRKLASQLVLARSDRSGRAVVSGRHVHVDAATGTTSQASPATLKAPEQSIDTYLFHRRRPNGGRASMYTSTILCSRDLALSVPWDPELPRHQDWDWLIRAERTASAHFHQVGDPVVRIQTGSTQSISARSDWESSLTWARARLHADRRVFADFVGAQPLRYALAARSLSGVRAVVSELTAVRRIPSSGPLLIGLGGLLPRRAIERIMVRFT